LPKAEADIAANRVRDIDKIFTTPDFWATYAELSPEMKEQGKSAYQSLG